MLKTRCPCHLSAHFMYRKPWEHSHKARTLSYNCPSFQSMLGPFFRCGKLFMQMDINGTLLFAYGREIAVRFEVFPAVTMKNAVFWDEQTHFVPHRKHITSPLQRPAG
jgi:hypothetical protein